MNEKETSRIGGFWANSLVIPLTILLAILHIFIVVLIYEVSRSTDALSEQMQRSSVYQQEATSLQAGATVLSETSGTFIQMPVTGAGEANVGPLMTFASELGTDRRGAQVAERFREYAVSDEARAYLEAAAENAEQMLDTQLHAIALIRTVYPLPEIPALAAIPDVPLTPEELAMPEEARVGAAKRMVLEQDYAQTRHFLAENIENCIRTVREDFARISAESSRHIGALRTALWVVVIAIIVLLVCTFVLFYRWLIRPLRSNSRQIASDHSMEQTSGIREMRLLVNAYNSLLRRRNKLESILRIAAETDSLTGLPNRYSMERYVMETAEDGGPMAVLLFDVNYLKRVNDTDGHLAGDRLLRTAASCIRECFGTGPDSSCYRIGGDEFAAVLRVGAEEDVKTRIDRFQLALEREDISVSVGYAFAPETDEDSFQKLMDEADKHMYEQKKLIHEEEKLRSSAE